MSCSRPDGELVLEVQDLTVGFPTGLNDGWRTVVDGLSLAIRTGERVGLVGESGSGKSVAALACLGLVPEPGRIRGGRVAVDGVELGSAGPGELRRIRGGSVGVVFQEPSAALNPVLTVGFQLAEVVRSHRRVARAEAAAEARRLLEEVALDEVASVLGAYPHRLSGGQLQRVVVAMALAGEPRLIIADEPTTAVDTITQARVLEVLRALTADGRVSLLLISHDLSVMSGMVERAYVMFSGRVVEEGPTRELFAHPYHPYTRLLLAVAAGRPRPRAGQTPQLRPPSVGCRFAHRCPHVLPSCRECEPVLETVGADRRSRCPVTAPDAGSAGGG